MHIYCPICGVIKSLTVQDVIKMIKEFGINIPCLDHEFHLCYNEENRRFSIIFEYGGIS